MGKGENHHPDNGVYGSMCSGAVSVHVHTFVYDLIGSCFPTVLCL